MMILLNKHLTMAILHQKKTTVTPRTITATKTTHLQVSQIILIVLDNFLLIIASVEILLDQRSNQEVLWFRYLWFHWYNLVVVNMEWWVICKVLKTLITHPHSNQYTKPVICNNTIKISFIDQTVWQIWITIMEAILIKFNNHSSNLCLSMEPILIQN